MKFYIFPSNDEKISPAVTGFDINPIENCITVYVNIHLPLEKFFKHHCAITTVMDKFWPYLYETLGNINLVRENESVHNELHTNEQDKKEITHIHIHFNEPLTVPVIQSFFNAFINYQQTHLTDGTRPLLIPNIRAIVSEIMQEVREHFGKEQFANRNSVLNCDNKCPPANNFYLFRHHPKYLAAQKNYKALPETECTPINTNLVLLAGLGMAGMLVVFILLLAYLYNRLSKQPQNQQAPENRLKRA